MINTENSAEQEWLQERIEYLAEFMTPERKETLQNTISKLTRKMTILTENTFHSNNASELIRN